MAVSTGARSSTETAPTPPCAVTGKEEINELPDHLAGAESDNKDPFRDIVIQQEFIEMAHRLIMKLEKGYAERCPKFGVRKHMHEGEK